MNSEPVESDPTPVLSPSFSLDQKPVELPDQEDNSLREYIDLKPVVVPHISSNWHGFYVSGKVKQAGTGIHSGSVSTDILLDSGAAVSIFRESLAKKLVAHLPFTMLCIR